MIKKSAFTFLLAISCLTVAAAPASALNWGGEVFGAFSTHSMKEWNDRVIVPAQQGGTDIDEFSTGFGGGLGLRMWPNSNWMLSATWEPLFVSRETNSGSSAKIDLAANAFEVTGGYFFPTASQVKFGLGAGVGMYALNGEVTSSGSPTTKVEGNTIGFHLHGLMEYLVSPGFAITGNAGYRFADISDTELDGQSVTPDNLSTDYSGLALRAGVAFYLPRAGQ